MSNTAGRTWDFGTIPYMPFPVQWLKRFNEINKAKNNYGLCGLMEGHHYGAFPSFISRLAQLSFMFEDKPEENLRRVYNAYFENSSDELIDAFEDVSKAITFLPPSVEEQYGPCRNGTAYPLCLATSKKPPRLENVVSAGKISIERSTGDIELERSDAAELFPVVLTHGAEEGEKPLLLAVAGFGGAALQTAGTEKFVNVGSVPVQQPEQGNAVNAGVAALPVGDGLGGAAKEFGRGTLGFPGAHPRVLQLLR
jgi:hypothetical protein